MKDDIQLEMVPVVLTDTTVVLLRILHCANGLEDLYLHDYINPLKNNERAAKELIKGLSPYLSINLAWAIRDAVKDFINEENSDRGTNFPIDRDDNFVVVVNKKNEG